MQHKWKIFSESHHSKGKSHQVAVSATGSGFLSQPKESCKSNFYNATACSLGTFWKSSLCRRKPLQHLQKLRVFGENHPFHRFLADESPWTHQKCRSPSTCLPCWTHQPLNRSSYSKMLWPCWCADVLGLNPNHVGSLLPFNTLGPFHTTFEAIHGIGGKDMGRYRTPLLYWRSTTTSSPLPPSSKHSMAFVAQGSKRAFLRRDVPQNFASGFLQKKRLTTCGNRYLPFFHPFKKPIPAVHAYIIHTIQ